MTVRKIIVAPDSFKGSLSAREAARAIARAVRQLLPDSEVIEHPVSDGGEGLVDVLVGVLGGTIETTEVSGPLPDQRVQAGWGLVGDGKSAVIEMAAAAGLYLVPEERRDPKITTTYGVGELILAALDRNVRTIILGIGGSATNDGGAGMAEALGVKFLDEKGGTLARGGAALAGLAKIDRSGRDRRIDDVKIIAACDVRNPLVGPEGATAVYGPQKGATPEDVVLLNGALRRYAEVIRESLGEEIAGVPGAGAAGGLGAGLLAFCNAELKRGIDVVLDATGFDDALKGADLLITGEGKIDEQVRFGKALAGVVERARQAGVPVLAVAGMVEGERSAYIRPDLFRDIESLVDASTPVEAAMRDAERLLSERVNLLLTRYPRK